MTQLQVSQQHLIQQYLLTFCQHQCEKPTTVEEITFLMFGTTMPVCVYISGRIFVADPISGQQPSGTTKLKV
jgi:hypothetical protein